MLERLLPLFLSQGVVLVEVGFWSIPNEILDQSSSNAKCIKEWLKQVISKCYWRVFMKVLFKKPTWYFVLFWLFLNLSGLGCRIHYRSRPLSYSKLAIQLFTWFKFCREKPLVMASKYCFIQKYCFISHLIEKNMIRTHHRSLPLSYNKLAIQSITCFKFWKLSLHDTQNCLLVNGPFMLNDRNCTRLPDWSFVIDYRFSPHVFSQQSRKSKESWNFFFPIESLMKNDIHSFLNFGH